MPIVEVSLRGFAFIGMTLCVLALTIMVYLYRRPRTPAVWLLIGFFSAITLSGIATILTNAFLFWGSMFDPWQDAFVLLGGVSLVLFAYQFPRYDQPREARIFAALMIGLTALAMGYALVFDYNYMFAYTPGLDNADEYYALMPIGTLIVVIAFARRATLLQPCARRRKHQPAILRVAYPASCRQRGEGFDWICAGLDARPSAGVERASARAGTH